MKIEFVDANINPPWVKRIFQLYFGVAIVLLYAFGESYLSESHWFSAIEQIYSQYFPVIKYAKGITDFPKAHALYLMVMSVVFIISIPWVLFRNHEVNILSFRKNKTIFFHLFLSFCAFFVSLLALYIIYFSGLSHVNQEIGRTKAVQIVMNGSKLGMALIGSSLFWGALAFFYSSFIMLVASVKYYLVDKTS